MPLPQIFFRGEGYCGQVFNLTKKNMRQSAQQVTVKAAVLAGVSYDFSESFDLIKGQVVRGQAFIRAETYLVFDPHIEGCCTGVIGHL